MKTGEKDNHIAILDGLRGAMAFWVFYGHLKIFYLGSPPRFGHPAQAVDVFMFLSGFLMTYHWLGRQSRFDGAIHQTWDFYIRRFFRIAPVYYILFTIAYAGQKYFVSAGHRAAQMLSGAPGSFSEAATRPETQSWLSAILHYTFLFGFFPHFVSNNALPDWSIGLEMQFYAFFQYFCLSS
jgi:peptidoglycan/LPS O-acetylase OafA/YrhL